ncbi:MAG TPA: hypothetical protein VK828_12340 [Terriglobales bacterium]|jgi:hypothetical protein|nr:hypothetical protein [Terriglobales bacterium]
MNDPAEKPYCIAFGIPTTRQEFIRSQAASESDYSKRWLGGWGQYRAQFVSDLEIVAPDMEHAGVELVRGLRVGKLSSLFFNRRVVVLFSHWAGDKVEFFDGMASVEIIMAEIPAGYDGVLDLCVCHPIALVEKLLARRPAYLVKYLRQEAAPHYWLYFYRDIFRYMSAQNVDYLKAFEVIAKAHITLGRSSEDGT